jgi:hypothetical protein
MQAREIRCEANHKEDTNICFIEVWIQPAYSRMNPTLLRKLIATAKSTYFLLSIIYIYMTIHPLGTRSLLQQTYHCSPQEDGGDCTAAGGDEGEGEGEGVREATTARARREAAVGVPPESIAVAGRCPWVCGRPITLVHFIK